MVFDNYIPQGLVEREGSSQTKWPKSLRLRKDAGSCHRQVGSVTEK